MPQLNVHFRERLHDQKQRSGRTFITSGRSAELTSLSEVLAADHDGGGVAPDADALVAYMVDGAVST